MAKKSLLMILLLFSAALSSHAQSCMLQPVPLDQRVYAAEAVIEGKVVRQQSYWNQARTQILTANFIEVYKVFKGAGIPDTVAFVVQGGQVGLDLLVVNPGIGLETGNYGVFTLTSLSDDFLSSDFQAKHPKTAFFRDNAWSQSFIAVTADAVLDIFYPIQGQEARQQLYNQILGLTGRTTFHEKKAYVPAFPKTQAADAHRSSAIVSFSPANVAAGTLSSRSMLTITGSGFGTTRGSGEVQFKNANDGGGTFIAARTDVAGEYVSWSDTEIIVRVPGGAGTGPIRVITGSGSIFTSSNNLIVDYNTLNIIYNTGSGNNRYEPGLVNQNGAGGYTLTYNINFYNNANALPSFRDALKNWVHRTGVNFTDANNITSTISTNNTTDAINIVTFTATSNGTLGVSYSSWSGCFSGGQLKWRLQDVDMVFNNAVSWYYGCDATAIPSGSYDFQSVAVHELGHHHQLGHIIDPTKVMHFNIGTRQIKRTIQANDKEGGDYVISHSIIPNGCGPGPMTTISGPAPDCAPVPQPLPVELIAFEARPGRHNQVNLTWTTATEEHNSHFTIERSTNGQTFEPLLQVPGKGNSNSLQHYSTTDLQPYSGTSYYRLKQTDFDGQFSYSKTVVVNLNHKSETGISIYPNPAKEALAVNVISAARQPSVITIRDAAGRQSFTSHQKLNAGSNLIRITLPPFLPAGLYMVEVMLQEAHYTTRLVIE